MERIITLSLLALMMFPVTAQVNVDSLINVVGTASLTFDEKTRLYMQICDIYLYYDMEKSFAYAQKALLMAEKEKNPKSQSIFNETIGRIYTNRAMFDSAAYYYDRGLEMAKRSGDEEREACLYLSLGVYYRNQSKYEEAIDSYLKALLTYERIGKKANVVTIYSNIGSIYRTLNNFDQALHYLKRAEEIIDNTKEIDYPISALNTYYELGGVYTALGDGENELKYTSKTLDMARKYKNVMFEIGGLHAMSYVYLRKEDYPTALQYAKEALQLSEQYGQESLKRGILGNMSDIYLEMEAWTECESTALKAYESDTTDVHHNKNTLRNITLSNIHLNNVNKASVFLNKYEMNWEKISDVTLHESIANMEVKYETEKKELQIVSLQKEKQLYIWLAAAGIIVMVLFFGVLSFRHRLNVNKRKVAEQARELAEQKIAHLEQEKQLIATKAVLDGETAERSRLAKDLHDGLGGMLSVVKLNLKNIKTYSVMDTSDVNRFNQALAKLEQSIGEIRRVSHNMMPESLFRDGLKSSLESFCEDIPNAHFHFFGEDRRLESSLEILLYRCAYELINNAMKHANATNIQVQLIIDNGLASLTVMDDGVGFEPDKVTQGTGLKNIRTRVTSCAGKLNVYSSPGKGTETCIEVELTNEKTTRDKNSSVNGQEGCICKST